MSTELSCCFARGRVGLSLLVSGASSMDSSAVLRVLGPMPGKGGT